jgi:hypothetical protein
MMSEHPDVQRLLQRILDLEAENAELKSRLAPKPSGGMAFGSSRGGPVVVVTTEKVEQPTMTAEDSHRAAVQGMREWLARDKSQPVAPKEDNRPPSHEETARAFLQSIGSLPVR